MFRRLVVYKEKHKTISVPSKCKENPQLGQWVSRQRTKYKKNIVSKYRVDLLNSIGFVWKLRVPWIEMYQKLVAYKKQHKSTSVPRCYKEDLGSKSAGSLQQEGTFCRTNKLS